MPTRAWRCWGSCRHRHLIHLKVHVRIPALEDDTQLPVQRPYGPCTSPLRIIVSPRKPSKMPPIQPVLEGARPWSHTFFITNSPCWHSYGSSFCCLSLGPSQVYSLHPCQRSPRRAWRCWGLCRHWHLL